GYTVGIRKRLVDRVPQFLHEISQAIVQFIPRFYRANPPTGSYATFSIPPAFRGVERLHHISISAARTRSVRMRVRPMKIDKHSKAGRFLEHVVPGVVRP